MLAASIYFCVVRSDTIVACNKACRPRKACIPFYLEVSLRSSTTDRSCSLHFQDMRVKCFRKPTAMENVHVIFGRNPWMWLLPVPSNEGDGWLHSCTCQPDEDETTL